MNFLVACALLLQDKTAEETFRKIEETILNSKTVSVKFQFVIDVKRAETALRIEGPGTMLLKDGQKLRLTFKYPEGSGDKEYDQRVDGEKGAREEHGKWKQFEVPFPKGMEHNSRLMLIRGGILGPTSSSLPWFVYALAENLDKAWQVSEVKQGADDGKTKTLTYRLQFGEETPTEVRLWYDADSFKPMKRTYRFKVESDKGSLKLNLFCASGEGTFTEAYEELVLNADIPDEKFKLPAEK